MKKLFDSTKDSLKVLVEPENKITFLTSAALILKVEEKKLKNSKVSMRFLEEDLEKTELVLFSMFNFSPYFEEFRNKIYRFLENGILKDRKVKFEKKVELFRYGNLEGEIPPLILNMADLETGFLVCLTPLSFSIAAFICELALRRIKATAIKMKEFLTFLFLIRTLARTKIGLF